jgi:hypothetical protein
MQIGKRTKKGMLSSKIIKAEMYGHLQDGRRRYFGNSRECYKMGNYHRILMQIGTRTMKNMPRSKITIPEV